VRGDEATVAIEMRAPGTNYINLGGLGLKKYEAIEGSLPVDSKSRDETTIGRENELFWTEKFIVPAGLHFMRRRSTRRRRR
jgi:hypothetical protein